MKVVVTGGRKYADVQVVTRALSAVHHKHGISELIHGGATGADTLASDWARGQGIPSNLFRADWKGLGRAAGPLRNQRMIDEGKPDAAVAFPGGDGTADMVRRLERAGIRIWNVA